MTTRKFTETFNSLAGNEITATEFEARGEKWVGIAVDNTVLDIYDEKQIKEIGKCEVLNILSRARVLCFARTQRNAKVICNHPMRKTFEEILNERK